VRGMQRGRKRGGKGKRAPVYDVHESRKNRNEHLSRVQGRVLPISLLRCSRAKVARVSGMTCRTMEIAICVRPLDSHLIGFSSVTRL